MKVTCLLVLSCLGIHLDSVSQISITTQLLYGQDHQEDPNNSYCSSLPVGNHALDALENVVSDIHGHPVALPPLKLNLTYLAALNMTMLKCATC